MNVFEIKSKSNECLGFKYQNIFTSLPIIQENERKKIKKIGKPEKIFIR